MTMARRGSARGKSRPGPTDHSSGGTYSLADLPGPSPPSCAEPDIPPAGSPWAPSRHTRSDPESPAARSSAHRCTAAKTASCSSNPPRRCAPHRTLPCCCSGRMPPYHLRDRNARGIAPPRPLPSDQGPASLRFARTDQMLLCPAGCVFHHTQYKCTGPILPKGLHFLGCPRLL